MTGRVLGLVGSGSGGVDELLRRVIRPVQEQSWTVAVTLTPTAGRWLHDSGGLADIEAATGFPVRVEPRFPHETSPHPPVDCFLVAPASANTVAKMALGIADNQALTQLNEAIGTHGLPIVVFPRVNAAHARHPAWKSHLEARRKADVRLVYGDDVWPLHEPRSAPGRDLPWPAVLDAVNEIVPVRP